MNDKFNTKDKVSATLTMNTGIRSTFGFKNPVVVDCYDKDGNLKWSESNFNLMTDEGLNDILDVYFSDGSQDATVYIGLKGTGAMAASDTLASHANWTEFTSYTGNRQAWVEGGVSAKSISNSGSVAVFPITGAGSVYGAFLTNAATGTTGVLVSGADFASSRTVAENDTLNVTYTITVADA